MVNAGPLRSKVCATVAAIMLSRLPAMEKARTGVMSSTDASLIACGRLAGTRPNCPDRIWGARSRAVMMSLCSATDAPTNTPVVLRGNSRPSYPPSTSAFFIASSSSRCCGSVTFTRSGAML